MQLMQEHFEMRSGRIAAAELETRTFDHAEIFEGWVLRNLKKYCLAADIAL